jgi:uncharacterized membrane protein YfcA
MHPSILIVGFIVGLLMGLTSVGGAALMTPFLILGLDVSPFLAVGTDLVYGTITRIAGAWLHWRQGTADVRLAFRMCYGSVPGCIIGAAMVNLLHGHWSNADTWLRRAIGAVLVVVALLLIARTLHLRWIRWRPMDPNGRGLIAVASLVGFLVGFTSIGSGSLLAPILIAMFPKQTARAVGTDIFHAAILAGVAALAHAGSGNVAWPLLPVLLAGSLPGVLLGSYLAPRLPSRSLRVGVAVALLAGGIKLF